MKDVLVAQNLYKKFYQDPNMGLWQGSADIIRAIFKSPPNQSLRENEIWAVHDVSFNLKEGETLGLIGTNGSGKSTTLRMLAGLILPSRGNVSKQGTMQSLINLGAGLNPELSGYDNIIASSSLLGLKKSDLPKIIERVVEFSELGDYINNPIKTYSSGMYSRLGFSIAVNLKPDILLVDEVLAVGDYNFQNKCRIHIEKLKREGVSIVLVSHSNTHISQICENSIWLNKGKVMSQGRTKDVLGKYIEFLDGSDSKRDKNDKSEQKNNIYGPIYKKSEKIEAIKIKVNKQEVDLNDPKCEIQLNSPLKLDFEIGACLENLFNTNVTVTIYREDGLHMFAASSLNQKKYSFEKGQTIKGELNINHFNLSPGRYKILMPVHEGSSYLFRNVVADLYIKGNMGLDKGVIAPQYDFRIITEQRGR